MTFCSSSQMAVVEGPKWVAFRLSPQMVGAKTQRWDVTTKDGKGVLGTVKWYSPWRRFAFFPLPATTFDAACLREIADFCEGETRKHKGTEAPE